MKLIVGLGNPGDNYKNTRHNVGFMALDNYTTSNKLSAKEKFNALIYETRKYGEKILFVKPLTYMNNSGDSVRKIVDFYKIKYSDILIIYDDKNFDVGKYRIKRNGTSGGHNGLEDIIKKLGTTEIKRMKIGIGLNNNDLTSYVLGKFSKSDREKLKIVFDETKKICEDFIIKDFDELMSKYNRR